MTEPWDSDGTRTPDDLFIELNSRYHFVRDLFASELNAKLPEFYSKEDSALEHEWERLSAAAALKGRQPKLEKVMRDGELVFEPVLETIAVPDGPFGWVFGNPPYSHGWLDKTTRYAIEQAKRGSGVVFVIPSSTGTGWFQRMLCSCDVLGSNVVAHSPRVRGVELSMAGAGYRQTITFLAGRVPFLPPVGFPESRKWSTPAGDSVLIEWRPS